MKQRPILFSTPMVQAIMEGRKTMTRRVVKPQPEKLPGSDGFIPLKDFVSKSEGQLKRGLKTIIRGTDSHVFPDCPYGKPGDVLWVRETWAETTNVNDLSPWPNRPHLRTDDIDDRHTPWEAIIYRADGEWIWCDADGYSTEKSHWKPSIHMPKDAARIWLRITKTRVERLLDISDEDAIAEGIDTETFKNMAAPQNFFDYMDPTGPPLLSAFDSFISLWDSINGEFSADEDPSVWVIEFERIEKPENA